MPSRIDLLPTRRQATPFRDRKGCPARSTISLKRIDDSRQNRELFARFICHSAKDQDPGDREPSAVVERPQIETMFREKRKQDERRHRHKRLGREELPETSLKTYSVQKSADSRWKKAPSLRLSTSNCHCHDERGVSTGKRNLSHRALTPFRSLI